MFFEYIYLQKYQKIISLGPEKGEVSEYIISCLLCLETCYFWGKFAIWAMIPESGSLYIYIYIYMYIYIYRTKQLLALVTTDTHI